MKATILFGSPHRDGFTGIMLDEYLKADTEISEITIYDAYSMNAQPCIACGACASADSCIYNDLDSFFDSVYSSDRLIIASPVYFLSFPSPLKAIIDRCQRYHEALKRADSRMNARKRDCIVLVTAGAPSENGDVIKRQMRWVSNSLGIAETKVLVVPDTDRTSPEEFRKAFSDMLASSDLNI